MDFSMEMLDTHVADSGYFAVRPDGTMERIPNPLLLGSLSRKGQVDTQETQRLLNAAKGDRSIREFAKLTDMNESSMSRMLSGQTVMINPKLIIRIVQNAEAGSGVTLEKMLAAQGLVIDPSRKERVSRVEDAYRRTIADALLNRGFQVRYEKNRDPSGRIEWDVRFITDALGDKESVWAMEFKTLLHVQIRPFSDWLDRTMLYFYKGGKAGRASFVIEDPLLFKQIERRLSELSIPDEISVILISRVEGKVVDEYVAPLKDGRQPKFIFGRSETKSKEG